MPYHDTEWGFPVSDDVRLFEKVCLEGFQSGLSWRTVLAKRPRFREVFAGFDFNAVAGFDESDVLSMLGDAGIIRHRGKIEATINNAQRAIEMVRTEGSLAAFFWSFELPAGEVPEAQTVTTSASTDRLSKALKDRGWKFVGPTTSFAFAQAVGLVNDHVPGCVVRDEVAKARAAFTVPTPTPIPIPIPVPGSPRPA